MKLSSLGIINGQAIHPRYAFGKQDKETRIALSTNLNPDFTWSDAPVGTKSFALVMVDVDVPTKADDVNQIDREVPADLLRTDFYHWTLIDIPADVDSIAEGEFSNIVTPKGKAGPLAGKGDIRHGLNNYTEWFANDHDMQGEYFGYDGPCPPFNDAIPHRYYFTLYALDVEKLSVEGNFTGPDVLKAMEGHILAQATLVGTYSLNPRLTA